MSKATPEQIYELNRKIFSGEITAEELQPFLCGCSCRQDNEERERSEFAPANENQQAYPVKVDYSKSLSEMIAAGRYDFVDSDINDRNFPQSGIGKASMEAFLVHLNKYATTQEVLDYLESQGMRPATLPELLAFGATNPEIQRRFPVVGAGSSRVSPGDSRRIPCLSGLGSERDLGLVWLDSGWSDECRFLAVRK